MASPLPILVIGDSFVDVCAGPLDKMPDWGGDVASPDPIMASLVSSQCSLISMESKHHTLNGEPACVEFISVSM
jgi:hypothetical protein